MKNLFRNRNILIASSILLLELLSLHGAASLCAGEVFSPTPEQTWTLTAPLHKPNRVVLADINKDGRDDLLVACAVRPENGQSQSRYALAVFFNKDGKFSEAADILKDDFKSRITDVAVGDFNADGCPEIAVLEDNRWLSILTGKAPLTIIHKNYSVSLSRSAPLSARKENLTKTIFVAGGVIWNYENGKFLQGYVYPPADRNTQRNMQLQEVKFFNNETFDLLATTSSNNIRIYQGPFMTLPVKAENCTSVVEIPFGHPIAAMAACDFNHDGRKDIIVCGPTESAIFLQNSPMGFSESSKRLPLPGGNAMVIGDFSGEKNANVIIATSKALRCFSAQTEIQSIPFRRAYGLAKGVIFGGKYNDIAVILYSTGRIALFKNIAK